MEFPDVERLLARFELLGAVRIFCKRLSENDNSKNQIYLGGSFEVLSFFPYGEVREFAGLREPNLKASVRLFWVTPEAVEHAPGAQLILYPQYPEVRLSGFIAGCGIAPGRWFQPVARAERKGRDDRVLVFGTTQDQRVLVHLATPGSPLCGELLAEIAKRERATVFVELAGAPGSATNRRSLVVKLREIHRAGFHPSQRLDRHGTVMEYRARNGGGYTLEALLGIRPNANADPDYHGWEVKAHSGGPVTVMTPEPDAGFYSANGVEAFVRKYGHHAGANRWYFTGLHRAGRECNATKLTLTVDGYDDADGKIVDVAGQIAMRDQHGDLAAAWRFSGLLTHWNRKHAFAAYVPYERRDVPLSYRYNSPALLGEGTSFPKYLGALSKGLIYFDPGSRLDRGATGRTNVKARSQFRIKVRDLPALYERFTEAPLD